MATSNIRFTQNSLGQSKNPIDSDHGIYRGSAPAVVDLLAGQIPLASVDLTSAYPHIQASRLIALGLADSKRFPVTPEIPTIAEGGVPGFGRASGFIGLFAPAGTPAPVVKKLSRGVAAILATPGAQTTAHALTSAPTRTTRPSRASSPPNSRSGSRRCR